MRKALRMMGLAVVAGLGLAAEVLVGVLRLVRMFLPSSVTIPRDYDELQRPSREFEEKHSTRYRPGDRRGR